MQEATLSSQTPKESERISGPRKNTFLERLSKSFRTLLTGVLLSIAAADHAHTAEPASLAVPENQTGTLYIVGGGDKTDDILDAFIDDAGGSEARLVIIPTATEFSRDPGTPPSMYLKNYTRAKTYDILHTTDPLEADSDAFVESLQKGTGVWIVGGIQSRLSIYARTKTEKAIRELLSRGGVVGGTSAGAAVMSRVMIAGGRNPPVLGTGLGLFDGNYVVDQHFMKRDREGRLLEALNMHPKHSGLGIDENTAAIIRRDRIFAMGEGGVHYYPSESYRTGGRQVLTHGQEMPMPPVMLATPLAAER